MTSQATIYWSGMMISFLGGVIHGGAGLGLLVFGISAMVWAILGDEK